MGDLDPYQQAYGSLSAVLIQERALQNDHRLSASERSRLIGSIEGLMNQLYTQQGAITDRCSDAFQQLQASISAAAATEENLIWQENAANPPVSPGYVQGANVAGHLLGGALGIGGGAGMIAEATVIGTETTAAAAAGAVSFGIGAVGVVVGVWLVETATSGG